MPDRRPWHHKRKSRHERGYGTAWEKVRDEALKRDKRLCQPCLKNGRVTSANAVDHIEPKAKGGTDDLANLQSICRSCHLDKTMTDAGHRRKLAIGADGWPVENS
jgi:5-methylcytosine-specific restriction enzyme A